jgi:hypothetical protein
LGREPAVDSFGDGLPTWLEHHVVAHAGEELRFRAKCMRGLPNLAWLKHASDSAPNTSTDVVTRAASGRLNIV